LDIFSANGRVKRDQRRNKKKGKVRGVLSEKYVFLRPVEKIMRRTAL